jgi:hypothetical protein
MRTVVMFEDLGKTHPLWVPALRRAGFEVVTTNSPSMLRQLVASPGTVSTVVFDVGARSMRLAAELASLPRPPRLVVCTPDGKRALSAPDGVDEYIPEHATPEALVAAVSGVRDP